MKTRPYTIYYLYIMVIAVRMMMKTDNLQHRKSPRLVGYDYTLEGAYFITIVTFHRENLFGDVINGQMEINRFGKIVNRAWLDLPNHYRNISLDEYIIMPNHFHGIVVLEDLTDTATTKKIALSEIIRVFKAFSTRRIHDERDRHGNSVWQRSYYDHIIRNEREYQKIYDYIQTNPQNWFEDRFGLSNIEIPK